jgi:flagellar biosynthetic protein FlhB
MFGEDHDDRTEPPSPRRLDEARRSGYVPRSRDLTAAVMLLASASCLALFGREFAQAGVDLLRDAWSVSATTPSTLRNDWSAWEALTGLAEAAGACLVVLLVAAIAANLVQSGFVISPDAVRPNWSRINPAGGLRRWSAGAHPTRLAMTLLKLAVVSGITFWSVADAWPGFTRLPYADGAQVAEALGAAVVRLALSLAAALLLLSAGDLLYQRWRYERSLRMTRAEARDEARLHERNPDVSRKQREAARQVSHIAAIR